MMTKTNWGQILLSGASLAALSAFGGAFSPAAAQDVTDEIVVTATGRASAIQDVPLAVQALSGETLEQAGVNSVLDLEQVAPSLRLVVGQSTTAGTIAQIRGIGTGADNPGFESAVGFFIDGVYRARAGTALGDLPELERIEVLRGPQGTLYGKNTSAGAISIITASPEHEFGAWGEIGAGERNELRTAFGATGGLSDTFAVRFDGAIRAQDGYIEDVTSDRDINNTNRWNARGQALWDINDDASLRVIIDGSQTDENCCGAVNIQTGTTIGALAGIYFPGAILPPNVEERELTVSPNREFREQADDFGISGELTWDLGFGALTSITAYRDWSAERDQDVDFSSIDRAYRDGLEIGFETFSQEFRLQGESGRLNWLVGAFFGKETLETTDRIRFGADATAYGNAAWTFLTAGLPTGPFHRAYATRTNFTDNSSQCLLAAFGGGCLPDLSAGQGQVADNWNVETQTAALFTHNEISLTDQLTWTIGLRYNHETKDLSANLNSENAACDSLRGANFAAALTLRGTAIGLLGPAGGDQVDTLFALVCNAVTNTLADGTWEDDREENEWSGTTSLAYSATDDLMFYGGYSRGYKAGGFNVDRSAFFGADNLTPLFGALPGQTLTTDDLQFEPEFTDAFELGMKSTIFGGTTYLNATLFLQQIHDYQQSVFSGFNFVTRNIAEVVSQGVELEMDARLTDNLRLSAGATYNDIYYDSTTQFGAETLAEGTPVAQAPEWTITGAINYSLPITEALAANFYLNGRYVTEYRVQTLNRNPITDNEAFALFDARVGIGNPNGRWGLDVFVRNLTDEYYNVGGFGAPERTLPGQPVSTGNYLVYPNEPRTVGVTLRARY